MKQTKKRSTATESPVHDDKAFIFPNSALKLGKNMREKLEHVEELAASIKKSGLLQPLIIAKVAGCFEYVAGRRSSVALKPCSDEPAAVGFR